MMGRGGAKIARSLFQPQGSQLKSTSHFQQQDFGPQRGDALNRIAPEQPDPATIPRGAANLLRRDHFHPEPAAQTSDFEMLLLGASFVTSRCGTDHRQM